MFLDVIEAVVYIKHGIFTNMSKIFAYVLGRFGPPLLG